MKLTVTAEVYFPLNIFNGQLIKEIGIDENGKVSPVYSEVPFSFHGLVTPYDGPKIAKMNEESRYITISKTVSNKKENESKLIMNAVKEIEIFISWLCYLTLKDFRIVQWTNIVQEKEHGIISIGKKFNLPIDFNPHPLVFESRGLSSYTINIGQAPQGLDDYLRRVECPKELHSIIRWYKKGMTTFYPEEKIIFWVTALEGLSGLIKEDGMKIYKCKNCGYEEETTPSVNKEALWSFIEELGYNKNKIYPPIQGTRSKYVHSVELDYNYNDEKLRLIESGTHSLVVLFISYYLKKYSSVPFKLDDLKIANHPLLGNIEYLKSHLDMFIEKKLYKRRKK